MQFIFLTVVTICSGSFVITIFCDLWLTQNEAFPICLQCFRIYLNKLPYWGTKCTTDRCNGFFWEVVTQCSNTKQDRYFTAIFMKTSCIFGNILVGYSSQMNSQKNFKGQAQLHTRSVIHQKISRTVNLKNHDMIKY